MIVDTIARKWHDQLIGTEPIDHQHAEEAIRAVYRAAGLSEPERFIWCASPLDAVWTALVVIGRIDDYNHAVLEDVERSKSGKQKLPLVRSAVAERLGIPECEVEGYLGKPFYRAEGFSPVAKRLMDDCVESWMARAEAGNDFLAPHAAGPFKPLHDLEQALHFEGYRYRDGQSQGSLYNQALGNAGNKHVAILGARSAQHRLYGNFAYVEVAIDEALAEAGKLQPTELQRAIWAAYQACGMWWPCELGVVFAERPAVAELTAEGPRMQWSDGFTVGGPPSPVATRSVPAAPAAPAGMRTLNAGLPLGHAERIAFLRKQGGALPHLDRYLAGEHEQVWKDLVALGQKAFADEQAPDALAVAYETMQRVDRNVRTIADRLQTIGYRFVYPGSSGRLFGLGKPKTHLPHVGPSADVRTTLTELEEVVGGPIPLSLRAFFEVVGEVNFNGDHRSLAPANTEFTSDPLMVCSAEDALAMVESEDRDGDDPMLIEFAPDALHKANISGGSPYSIAVPQALADARVEDAPRDALFVDYLRHAILLWGGFPGWEGVEAEVPAELDLLRQDLLPF